MHISEGVLSGPVMAAGFAAGIAGTAIGLKKIEYDRIVHVAILSAAFFVASLIHINIGPVSAHLILNGILGLLLGWAAFPAILIALMLQSVFFQYGGLTSLGMNTLVMALPAVACHYMLIPLIGRSPRLTFAGSFAAGFLSIFLSALLLTAALWLTEKNFWETCMAVMAAHVPVMIIEGIITGFCVSFLMKVYPEIIPSRTNQ